MGPDKRGCSRASPMAAVAAQQRDEDAVKRHAPMHRRRARRRHVRLASCWGAHCESKSRARRARVGHKRSRELCRRGGVVRGVCVHMSGAATVVLLCSGPPQRR